MSSCFNKTNCETQDSCSYVTTMHDCEQGPSQWTQGQLKCAIHEGKDDEDTNSGYAAKSSVNTHNVLP
jgi:hypothetical protein